MGEEKKALIVDSDRAQLENATRLLHSEQFKVVQAGDAQMAIELASREFPQLILIELDLPDMDGVQLCMELRENPILAYSVIIVLANREEYYSQIAALNAGADDCFIRPYNNRLFTSKIRAFLRRVEKTAPLHDSHVQGLRVDRERLLIEHHNEKIHLPRKEFEIMALLLSKPQKVFSRNEMITEIWGMDENIRKRTIDVHIRNLRQKIGGDLIRTIKGVGYKLELKHI